MYDYTEIDQHIEEFDGLRVVNYDRELGLSDPATTAPRLSTLWIEETLEPHPMTNTRKVAMVAVALLTLVGVALWSGWAILFGIFAIFALLPGGPPHRTIVDLAPQWDAFAEESALEDVQAIVIGPWFSEVDEGPQDVVERLTAIRDRLPSLRAIYFGDIVSEECEISWISQDNLTPLLDAFPQLETLVVRGANGLRFEKLRHDRLRKLLIQSGGMYGDLIADLAQDARLPSLEHLELWLGDYNYGFESDVEELRPLWQPDRFEALQTLALRNCQIADEIARELSTQPEAVSRLDRLDLSLGTLSDLGAEALYNNAGVQQLDELDLHHHYISPDWVAKLHMLPLEVNLDWPQEPPHPDYEDDRYVAVGE